MASIRLIVATCTLVIAPAARADTLTDLFNRVPGDMNTVAVINVREINQTPRAVKEKWRDNHETEYLAGAASVSPWTSVVVVGADLHPRALGRSWAVALLPVGQALSPATIATRENGTVQTTDGLSLVLSPRRGYITLPTPGIMAVSGTIPRQDFARWARSVRTVDKPAVSPYLQTAVAAHKDAHVLIATDLQDLFDPTALRTALMQEGATGTDRDLDHLVSVIAGARGLVFTAKIEEKTKATLRIEFAVPVSGLLPTFSRLWPKVLTATGMEISEFAAAEFKADGRAVVMTTEDLSDVSLRRVLTLIAMPGDAAPSEGAEPIKTPKESAALAASLRYYRAVNRALDDLRAQGATEGTGTTGRTGTTLSKTSRAYVRSASYFEAYAARIERLPLTDVDPSLVAYGASTAAKLRAMAGSLRGVKVQLEAFESYKSTTWAGAGGWWGGNVALSSNVQEMDSRSADLVAKLEPERAKIWNVLEGDRSAVRREMLEKYKIDFDQFRR
jgi:hypothetical protein